MPESRSRKSPLSKQIEQARQTLSRSHYFTEATWLTRLQESPEDCGTTAGRQSLYNTKRILTELGCPEVAAWIGDFLTSAD